MMIPTKATANPMTKKMRQPQAVNAESDISDSTKITEPSGNPIEIAKPTHAPQKARYRERAACLTTQVDAVPNLAPKLMPMGEADEDQQRGRGYSDRVVSRCEPDQQRADAHQYQREDHRILPTGTIRDITEQIDTDRADYDTQTVDADRRGASCKPR